MDKNTTDLLVLQTRSASPRPLGTTSTSRGHGVVKAGVEALYHGTGMPFAGANVTGLGDNAVMPRVRINPSGTTSCSPPG